MSLQNFLLVWKRYYDFIECTEWTVGRLKPFAVRRNILDARIIPDERIEQLRMRLVIAPVPVHSKVDRYSR